MKSAKSRRQQYIETAMRGMLGLALALGVLWAVAGHDAQPPPPAVVALQG
ncbi:hypothetical protein [Vulcaniibacterium gelatinicum]|nr:hypothetical protein [Vulcaniibacterium gelatinicum]